MKNYRFSVGGDVSVCFSVKAENTEEAIVKAQQFVDLSVLDCFKLDLRDDCDDSAEDRDAVLYLSNEITITEEHLEDIEEEAKGPASCDRCGAMLTGARPEDGLCPGCRATATGGAA